MRTPILLVLVAVSFEIVGAQTTPDVQPNSDAEATPDAQATPGAPGGDPDTSKPWEISVGAGAFYAPRHDGSDRSRLAALPSLGVVWNERVYLRVPQGLGMYLIRRDRVTVEAGAGYNLGRDENQSDHLDGLGDIDDALTVRGSVSYRLGPLISHVDATRFVGGSDGLVVRAGLRAMIPIGLLLSGDLDRVRSANASASGPTTHTSDRDGDRSRPGLALMLGTHIEWADEQHSSSYFGVDQSQSQASGLDQFEIGDGFTSFVTTAGIMYPIADRWTVNANVGYTRFIGDAADSPVVEERDQYSLGLLAVYRFRF